MHEQSLSSDMNDIKNLARERNVLLDMSQEKTLNSLPRSALLECSLTGIQVIDWNVMKVMGHFAGMFFIFFFLLGWFYRLRT